MRVYPDVVCTYTVFPISVIIYSLDDLFSDVRWIMGMGIFEQGQCYHVGGLYAAAFVPRGHCFCP